MNHSRYLLLPLFSRDTDARARGLPPLHHLYCLKALLHLQHPHHPTPTIIYQHFEMFVEEQQEVGVMSSSKARFLRDGIDLIYHRMAGKVNFSETNPSPICGSDHRSSLMPEYL